MFVELEKATPLVQKVAADYEKNFKSRKEICISLSISEIREILLEDNIGKTLAPFPTFKFYLRQLFLTSLIEISTAEVRRVTANIEMIVINYKEPEVRNLLATIQLKCILFELSENDLYKILTDDTYDAYCRQIAYDEFQKRTQHRKWRERIAEKEKHGIKIENRTHSGGGGIMG